MNPITANAMLPGRFFFTIGLKYSVAKLALSQTQPESDSWIRWGYGFLGCVCEDYQEY